MLLALLLQEAESGWHSVKSLGREKQRYSSRIACFPGTGVCASAGSWEGEPMQEEKLKVPGRRQCDGAESWRERREYGFQDPG